MAQYVWQGWETQFMGLAALWDYLCSISADNWAMTTEITSLNQVPREGSKGRSGQSFPHLPSSLCHHLISLLTPFQVEVGGDVQRALLGHQATWFLDSVLSLICCVALSKCLTLSGPQCLRLSKDRTGPDSKRNNCKH